MADERKHKHLELIQGIINRLSTNSFLLKGWSVVLVSALFAFSAVDSQPAYVLLAYIPVVIFWVLDGFYLWQERLYRKLYDHTRLIKDEDIDYSMNTKPFESEDSAPTWPKAIFSKTLVPFHGVLIFAVFVVMILMTTT